MPVTALPLDPGAQARALLHRLLEAGDVIGRDDAGRTVIQLAADDWLLAQLLTFDAGAEDLEDEDDVVEGPAVLSVDRVPATRICRQWQTGFTSAAPAIPLRALRPRHRTIVLLSIR